MKKRTVEDAWDELDAVHTEAISIVKAVAALPAGVSLPQDIHTRVRELAATLADQEREDCCYFCGSTRKENLGTHTATRLTMCLECHLEYR